MFEGLQLQAGTHEFVADDYQLYDFRQPFLRFENACTVNLSFRIDFYTFALKNRWPKLALLPSFLRQRIPQMFHGAQVLNSDIPSVNSLNVSDDSSEA